MSTQNEDRYLAALKARDADFSQRESAIKREEEEHLARGEALRIKRERFEAEMRAHAAALTSYVEFLNSNGRPTPPSSSTDTEDAAATFPSLRIGDQRKAVLSHIASVAKQGKGLTIRSISSATGVSPERVSNIVWKDAERGYLVRNGDLIFVTDRGMEFLRQAGVLDGAD